MSKIFHLLRRIACLSKNIFFRIQKNKCKEFPNGTDIVKQWKQWEIFLSFPKMMRFLNYKFKRWDFNDLKILPFKCNQPSKNASACSFSNFCRYLKTYCEWLLEDFTDKWQLGTNKGLLLHILPHKNIWSTATIIS